MYAELHDKRYFTGTKICYQLKSMLDILLPATFVTSSIIHCSQDSPPVSFTSPQSTANKIHYKFKSLPDILLAK